MDTTNQYQIREGSITLEETTHTYTKKKINWDIITQADTAKNAQGNLELKKAKVAPFEPYPETVPHVSIITVTRNRKHLFPIAIQNWLQLSYPKEKLEWIIVDDSDKPNQKLDEMLDQLMKMGHNIKYVTLNSLCTVGKKRNIGIEIASHTYLMMMDDDDVYYHDSILSKLSCIITYGKKIAFSRPISVYDIKNDQSYILDGFEDLPEASIMMTRDFWINHAKFDDNASSSEGHALLVGNEQHAIQIPFFFNFLCIQHSENATRRLRSITRLMGRRGMNDITKMRTMKSQRNFFKDLPKYFKELLTQLFENQQKLLTQKVAEPIIPPKKKKNKKKKKQAITKTENETNTNTIA